MSTAAVALAAPVPSFASDGGGLTLTVPALGGTVSSAEEPGLESAALAVPELPPLPALGDLEETLQVVSEIEAEVSGIEASLVPLVPSPVTIQVGTADVVSAAPKTDITPPADPDVAQPADRGAPAITAATSSETPHRPGPGGNDVGGAEDPTPAVLEVVSAKISQPDVESTPVPSAVAALAPAQATTPGSTGLAQISAAHSPGYQDENSQYQSGVATPEVPWHWSWSLAIDCEGNVTSLSTHIGVPAASNWAWDWIWNWEACAGTDPPPDAPEASDVHVSSISDSGNTHVSVRVQSPGKDGHVNQSTAAPRTPERTEPTATTSSSGLWNWNWTFAFCDTTTSFAPQLEGQAPHTWTWNWIWNWTCDAAVAASPTAAGEARSGADSAPIPPSADVIPAVPTSSMLSPVPAAPVDGSSLPSSLVPDLAVLATVDVTVAIVVEPAGPFTEVTELSPLSDLTGAEVSVVIVPTDTEPSTSGAARTPEHTRTATTHRAAGTPAGTVPPEANTSAGVQLTPAVVPRASPRPATSEPSVKRSTKRPSARPAPSRRARGPLEPFGQAPSSPGTGSGTLGGRVPSAPVAAVAALLAFFILAAPGLGRRIRIARELSPRSTHRSSIDHPG